MIPFSGLPLKYPRAHEAREAPGGRLLEAKFDESKKVVIQVEIVSDTHDRWEMFERKDFFAKMPALILFQSSFLLVFFWLSMILINSDNRKAKGSRCSLLSSLTCRIDKSFLVDSPPVSSCSILWTP